MRKRYPRFTESRIAKRWLVWQPWAVRHIRTNFPDLDLPKMMKIFCIQHRHRVWHCHNNHITWDTMLRQKLDDPFRERFEDRLKEAVHRGQPWRGNQHALKENHADQ